MGKEQTPGVRRKRDARKDDAVWAWRSLASALVLGGESTAPQVLLRSPNPHSARQKVHTRPWGGALSASDVRVNEQVARIVRLRVATRI